MVKSTSKKPPKTDATKTPAKTATSVAKKMAAAKVPATLAADKPTTKKTPAKQVLLSGGNPQVAKADGDGPVQSYLAAMPDWKQAIGRRLDALVTSNVPGVYKGIRWNTPFYGIKGCGWFMGFHVFTHYVKVNFFRGTSLTPVPSGGTGKDARWIDIHEDDLDEAQMTAWIRQAAALPGWGKI